MRIWTYVRRHGFDTLIVLAAVEAMVEVAARQDAADAPESATWLAIPLTGLLLLPLLLRRRFPFGAPATLWIYSAIVSFFDGNLIVFTATASVAGIVAAFLLGNLRNSLHARIGLAVVLLCAGIVVYHSPDSDPAELVFIPLLFALGWLGGFALRGRVEEAEEAAARAAQAERERDAASRIAVAEERARIARELHDVVAHAVSVMVLQAGAVRHKLPAEEAEDREALRRVEQTGRTALTEMRRLLAAMRTDEDEAELGPQPGLGELDALAAEVGRAGLPVRVHVEGEPVALPAAVDLSAYRIVQEGLTNALKHARASAADVTVRYSPREIEVEVRDDGRGAVTSDGLGHGLVGVRERVKIYGGSMTAGPSDGGGFVLGARLPLEVER